MAESSRPATPLDWYAETARTALETSLSTQQRAVERWADAFETAPYPGVATPARSAAWLYEIWAETLRSALVNLDDAVTADGVDLDSLLMLWLHAADDALADVGRSAEFAAAMDRSVEGTLTVQSLLADRNRVLVEAVHLPTDRDAEALGARLLDLEYRQKEVEDRVERLRSVVEDADAFGGEVD